MRAASAEALAACWAIGHEIDDRMAIEGWGAKIVQRLSADLEARFPQARGCSPRNLRYMRSFAAAWPDPAMVQRAVAPLPWGHHVVLLDKLDDPEARRWYAAAALDAGWSRDVLALQIESRRRERSGAAITNFARALPEPDSDLAQQATRDPYLFDFLGTTDTRIERDVEQSFVDHVGAFLLELGEGFAYVGRQVRLVIDGEEFFADLLFHHLRLRCYVVIELEAVAFRPELTGQLGMYVAAVDGLMAAEADGPTIGLLLCKGKNDVMAEYALRSMAAPIGIAGWTDALTTSLPAELASSLPSIADLEQELAAAAPDVPVQPLPRTSGERPSDRP